MKIVAHRGLQSKHSHENTLEAILLGDMNKHITGVEIDVRLTKDNRVVVIHDENIDRVSDGKGKVCDMSLKRLKTFNYGNKVKPSTISTLEEVLDRFSPNTLLIIEIKNEYDKNNIIASKVLQIVNNYPNLNIWLKSFEPDIIMYLKRYSSNKVGALINKSNQELLNMDVDFYSISKDVITEDMVSKLLTNGKDIMVWNIKSKDEFHKLSATLNNNIQDIYIISDILF